MTRRGFLLTSSTLFAGAPLWAAFAEDSAAATPSGLTVSVRDAHLREVGEKDAWSALRAIGAQGVEVWVLPDLSCPYLFGQAKAYSVATEDDARRLADDARAAGVRISAFCMANRFDERPDEEVEWVKRVARACKTVATSAIRIDVVPRRLKGEKFLKFAIDICKRIVQATEDTAVRFGVENHGRVTNDTDFLERLFDGVGSDRLGLTLDTANFYWFGYPLSDLYKIYERFARRVVHTHCKSIAYPEDRRNVRRTPGWRYSKYNCPIYEGDIDFKRVIAILRRAGYDNDLCIENESLGKFPRQERREVLAEEIKFLKMLV